MVEVDAVDGAVDTETPGVVAARPAIAEPSMASAEAGSDEGAGPRDVAGS